MFSFALENYRRSSTHLFPMCEWDFAWRWESDGSLWGTIHHSQPEAGMEERATTCSRDNGVGAMRGHFHHNALEQSCFLRRKLLERKD